MNGLLLSLMVLVSPSITQDTYYSSCPTPTNKCHDDQNGLNTSFVNIGSRQVGSTLDIVCNTLFKIMDEKCSYLLYVSGRFLNGTTKIMSYIVNVDSQTDFTFSSPSCSYTEKVIRTDRFAIGIRKIISGDCSDLIYPIAVGFPCPQYGSASDLPEITQVLRNNGVSCSDLVVLPRRFPDNCVTRQDNADTGNTANCPGQCYDDYYDPGYNSPCGCSK